MTETHPLVADYLRRLDVATSDLPPEIRDDLRADLSGHLDQAQREAVDEADLRTRIERLGPPEAIGAEARGGLPVPAAPTPGPGPGISSSRRDGLTVVLLVVGAVLGAVVLFPVAPIGAALGWLTGLMLLWTSTSWTPGEKALGTAVWPGGVVAPMLLGLLPSQVCTSVEEEVDGVVQMVEQSCEGFAMPPWLGIPVLILAVAAPVLVGAFLLKRAERRRTSTPSG